MFEHYKAEQCDQTLMFFAVETSTLNIISHVTLSCITYVMQIDWSQIFHVNMSLYARYVYCNITLVFGVAQSVRSVKPMIISAEWSNDVLICNIILVCNTEAQFWMLFSLKCGEESSVE